MSDISIAKRFRRECFRGHTIRHTPRRACPASLAVLSQRKGLIEDKVLKVTTSAKMALINHEHSTSVAGYAKRVLG
jgi:hypothetical protein